MFKKIFLVLFILINFQFCFADRMVYSKCLQTVIEIVTTSPDFKIKTKNLFNKVVANGGTSYGILLEGSPHPKEDFIETLSKTYDFQLHESYEDHMTVIERYSYDPVKNKLYLYNTANDDFKAIAFNKNLIKKLKMACK